jgi:hypothetical protein
MARPKKNNADYFSHDAGMRDHRKVKAIREKFGISGYAIWVMTLEYLTACEGNKFDDSEDELELLSGDFRVPATEIRDVLSFCVKLKLLFLEDGVYYSKSLNERLAAVYEKRAKAKEQAKEQPRIDGKFCSNNTDEPVVSVTEIPQSKVNESKAFTHTGANEEILKAVCEIFGKKYQPPKVRMTGEATWFRDIETQSLILQTSYPDLSEAINQIKAYQKYCKKTDRKLIGTAHKVADTVLSSDWINLLGERAPPPKESKFSDAEYNKSLWTLEAWETRYKNQLDTDNEFRQHFGYGKISLSKSVGSKH